MPKLVDEADSGPRLGALLRLCHQAFANRLAASLSPEEGPVLGAVIQPLWDRPDGMRLTELAAYAGITKQSMSELVDKVVSVGYVERASDPTDGRATLLRLTRKGREVTRAVRANVAAIEADWARVLGKRRLEALRGALAELLEHERGEATRRR